jgi:hypothetical protein
MLVSHPVGHFNPRDIPAWAAHVYASSFIPPPPVTEMLAKPSSTIRLQRNEEKCNRLLYFRTDIPKSVCKIINRHLQKTIGRFDTSALSEKLPNPGAKSLVRSTLSASLSTIHMLCLNRHLRNSPMCKGSQRNSLVCIGSGICIGFIKSSLRCNNQHGILPTSLPCTTSA